MVLLFPPFGRCLFMVNVGKYAIPTDCMGYEVFFSTDMSHQLTSVQYVQLYSIHSPIIYNFHQETHLVLAFLSKFPRPSAIEMPFDSSSSMLQNTPHQAAPKASTKHKKHVPGMNTIPYHKWEWYIYLHLA